jgi:hypothetical protein
MVRKRTFLILALVAFSAVGIASAEKPVVVEAGESPFSFNAGFTPKSLPERTFAPIVLNLWGKVQTKDGTQPPALTEFVLEADRNIAIDVRGYPTCPSMGMFRDTKSLEVVCRASIIGEGKTTVSVAFPEQPPVPAMSKLLVINGGTSGGKTTLYVHAYLTQPITTAIMTTVKVSRIHNRRFGTKLVATVPPIANYAGSITSFNLTINKNLKLRGKPFSMLDAKCPDGHLNAHGLAIFQDGTKAEAEVTRRCIGLER